MAVTCCLVLFRLQLLLVVCSLSPRLALGSQASNDVAVVRELVGEWKGLSEDAAAAATVWGSEDDPCRWSGVVCSQTTRAIINLHFSGANLSGGIPPAIGALGELTILDLSENRGLSWSIPREISHLTHLTHLKLSGCNFSGKVPQEIYNLPELQYLDLSNNPHLLLQPEAHTRIMRLRQDSSTFRGRKLLQLNGRTRLPIVFTYIALGCIGVVVFIIFLFCLCRWMSTRRTRHDVFIMSPAPAIAATTFQRRIFTPDDNDGPEQNP